MSLTSGLRRLRGSVRTSALRERMEAELRHHLELETEALVARGMAPAEARDAARRRFGSVALVKDDCRDRGACAPSTRWRRTSASPLRNLRKYPGYTAVVLLTLGARHRRQHRDLQRRPRRAAAAAAVRARRSAGRGPPAGAADRRRQRRRLGQGNRTTTGRRPPRSTPSSSTTRCRSTCSGRGEASRVQTGVVSRQLLRRARRHADARPHVPRRRRLAERAGGAGR